MQTAPAPQAATTKPKSPPRVKELPVVGSSLELIRDSLGFLDRVSREHGDVVEFHIPGQRILLFNHPDAIEQVLVAERDRLVKDKLTRELSLMLGNGLLVSEGQFWRKQRKLAQPAFHRERIASYGDVMVHFAERAVEPWVDGEARDIHRDMMRLTLDIVAKTLFGVEIAEVARKIEWSLEVLMDRFSGIGIYMPLALPLPGNLRAKKAIEQLDDIVYGIIRERRRTGDKGDLLSMLIAATSDEGEGGMDDKQLRDEAMTLLLAGHETTALTLGFALHLLAEHPEVQETLVREIDDVLGDRPATAADLPRLKYAEAVVRESMRLYPPAWALGREAIEPCTIGGYAIAPGTQLWVAQWVVHRDARWFPEPKAFRPERWEGDLARKLPKHAYFPFGGGPRVCIGNAFAMMEAVLALVTLVRRVRVAPAPDAKPMALVPSVTLRPKHGIRLVVSARQRSAASRFA
ncbi:MAG: cytochrome P450 [Deltaproteobacteria bacterium]|nr:cytochrome P450 [Deltaproteobacteria bacterium]